MKFINSGYQGLVEVNYSDVMADFKEVIGTDNMIKLSQKVSSIFERFILPGSVFVSAVNSFLGAHPALAAAAATAGTATKGIGLATRLLPIMNMVQELALPVGIIVSSWGLIEIIIGNPAGKEKIKYAIIGYIGMFVIPELFYGIHDAFLPAMAR